MTIELDRAAPAQPQPKQGDLRVVYVEDDERLARLTTQYLESHRVEVHLVTRGDRAVSEVLRLRPDVVLLDLMLPGTGGLEVCRQLRARCDVPIIMVTARTEDDPRNPRLLKTIRGVGYMLTPGER